MDFDLEHAKVTPFDGTALTEFFQAMEFRTLLSKVPALSQGQPVSGSVASPVAAVKPAKTKSGARPGDVACTSDAAGRTRDQFVIDGCGADGSQQPIGVGSGGCLAWGQVCVPGAYLSRCEGF